MWQHYFVPTTIDEALELLAAQPEAARVVAGGTDLVIEVDRGVRRHDSGINRTNLRARSYGPAEGGESACADHGGQNQR